MNDILIPGEKDGSNKLTRKQLDKLNKDFVEVFDLVFLQNALNPVKSASSPYLTSLTSLYFEAPTFTFFITNNIESITGIVLENKELRNFIFEVLMRLTVKIEDSEKTLQLLSEHILTSVRITTGCDEASLLPSPVQAVFKIDIDNLRTLLKSNPWLMIIFLSLINFTETVYYAAFVRNAATEESITK